jgi:hydroxymethylpyrimidine/phosphomethylpyrimidine kinase
MASIVRQVKDIMSSASHSFKVALTIAGSDGSGGAGVQADLKTFQALGVYGVSAVTAVTVQNTQRVYAVQEIDPQILHDQIACLFEDMTIHSLKIGMVASAELIHAVARALSAVARPPIVLDPVMVASSGYDLLRPDARQALIEQLLPLATVVTPNIPEAEALAGGTISNPEQMRDAARRIAELGAGNVVVTGGHLTGGLATDILYDGRSFQHLDAPRLDIPAPHGTGCTFSAAIAAFLAKGAHFFDAVQQAKRYVTGAIAHCLPIGKGRGPTHHFYELYARTGLDPEM